MNRKTMMRNRWMRRLGLSLSAILTAVQMSGGMVYAAPEPENTGSFLEEDQSLPEVQNVNCNCERSENQDDCFIFTLEWEDTVFTIDGKTVHPDHYEVYVNYDKDKTLEEQRKEGTPVWTLSGKTETTVYEYVAYYLKLGDVCNFRICAVYNDEICAVSKNEEYIIPGYGPCCPITEIRLEAAEYVIPGESTFAISYSLLPEELDPVENAGWLIWESDNPKIASVAVSSENPTEVYLTGLKPGQTTIRVYAIDSHNVEALLRVTVRVPDDWWMHMDKNELFLQAGENGLKTAYADYWEDSEVEWKSEDASVATVEAVNRGRSATIHALRPGTTTITVGVPGGVVTDRCTVTVGTDKPAEDAKRDDPDMVQEQDGTVYVVEKDGSINKHFTGMADYEYGSKFLMVDGAVAVETNGAQMDPIQGDIFYFLANGQVQYSYEGLAEYNDKWFYIKDGAVQTQMNAFVDYDGSKFLVAVGRIVNEYNGLAQDPQNTATGDWYYFADGQAQTQYTGLAQYDNAWFYIVDGKLATEYTGTVEYDGSEFNVVNGMVK